MHTATLSDLEALHEFAVDVIHDTYDGLVDPAYAADLIDTWWTPAALGPDVAEERVLLAVAGSDISAAGSDVVGVAHRGDWNGEPVMWKLYIAPVRRNQGLGARLVDELISSLPAATPRLRTEHIVANVRAGRFYQREGFQIDEIGGDPADLTAIVWRSKQLT